MRGLGYWASTQSTQTQEFRQESGIRNQIQVSGQPDPSSWFLSEHSRPLAPKILARARVRVTSSGRNGPGPGGQPERAYAH